MPWNYPFWQVLRFACAALVAGNAGVLKHSPNVTGCALAIEELFADAGAPAGPLHDRWSSPTRSSPRRRRGSSATRAIAAVTLTGSERAGEAVGAAAGRASRSPCSSSAAPTRSSSSTTPTSAPPPTAAAKSRFGNGGQSCIAAKRFIVAEPVADEFVRCSSSGSPRSQVGDPTAPGTTVGPMARADLRDGLHRQVARAVAQGATLVTGGHAVDRRRLLLRADRARPRRAAA